jgi:hypothetical protein
MRLEHRSRCLRYLLTMNDIADIDMKCDFLNDVTNFVGPCICLNEKCKSVVFETIGNTSGFLYIIEYDASSKGFSNLLISIKDSRLVVFNGKCDTESDVAQILRMVII